MELEERLSNAQDKITELEEVATTLEDQLRALESEMEKLAEEYKAIKAKLEKSEDLLRRSARPPNMLKDEHARLFGGISCL